MASRESKWSGIGGAGGGGGGDVSGPGVSTDGALPEFNGTTGALLRESTARIESDDLSLAGQLVKYNRDGTDLTADGSGLDVLGTGNATLAQLLFDPLLSSRWKAGPAGSLSAVLTIAATQIMQNKSLDNSNAADFKDTALRIEDPSDATKKIRFDAGLVTPGQTRVISSPDEDLTLAGLTNSQTLTNKLLQDSIFDGGSASSARKILLPKASKAALDALTQEEGLITFATDEDRAYVSNGTAQIKVGTVDGPASATDNQFVRFDGTTGKMIQGSAVSANDSGDMGGINDLDMAGDLTVGGNTVLTGNLEVNGTQTALNTDELQVEDQTIQVNFGGTDASAEGGGVEVVGTANAALARFQYDSSLTSKWKVGAAGSEKEIATLTDTQTVTNKTLNNTNAAAFKDSSFTLEDPADATKKVRFDAGAVTAGQTRVMSVPDADTTLLGTNTTQTVTNKTVQDSIIDGGTASASRRINLPKDTYANILALARSEGAVYYATDLDQIFTDDGTQLRAAGSGGSEGGVNLLTNPYDGWVSSGAGVTVAPTTTASELPLAGVESSGIKITFASGTDYARRRFQTNDAMLSTVLGLSWWQKTLGGYASSDAKLELWVNDDATLGSYTGSFTEVSLLSDVSGDTFIPASNAKLPLSTPYNFTSSATLKNYELRIVRVAGTGSIVIQRPSVGTPAMQAGSPIGKVTTWIPTGTWTTNTTYTGRYWQVGSRLIGRVGIALGGAPGGTSQLGVNLPSGLSLDTGAILGLGRAESLAKIHVYRNGVYYSTGTCEYDSTVSNVTLKGRFQIQDPAGTSNGIATITASSPSAWTNLDYLMIEIDVPILEWANMANVSVIPQNTQSPIKAGIIMPFAGSTVPTGWLECDGSSYAQSLYPQLFAVIGSTWATCTNPLTGSAYSAPSAGNFRVPDLRAAFLRGAGGPNAAGVTTSLAGYQADTTAKNGLSNSSSTATVTGTNSSSAVSGSHPITVSAPGNNNSLWHNTATTLAGGDGSNNGTNTVLGSNFVATSQTWTQGSGTAAAQTITGDAETRPDNVGVKYIIKAWDESFNLAGFAEATSTQMGLVQGGRLPGAPGTAVIEQYKVGEVLSATGSSVAINTASWTTVASVTLTPGVWSISIVVNAVGATGLTNVGLGLATATNSNTGFVSGDTNVTVAGVTNGLVTGGSIPAIIRTISTTTSYFLTSATSGASTTTNGRITAIRIA